MPQKKVAVLAVHGIGSYFRDGVVLRHAPVADRSYADAFFTRLQDSLRDDFEKIAYRAAVWSDPELEAAQEQLAQSVRRDLFTATFASRAIAELFSDATAYKYVGAADPRFAESNYFHANKSLHADLAALEGELDGAGDDTPLILVAHSMGCHVLSNYRWDVTRHHARVFGPGAADASTAFTRLDTVVGLFFLGCNLPLFTLGVRPEDKIAFPVPGLAMRERHLADEAPAVWKNYHDPDDWLGYPVANETRAYFEGAHPDYDPASGRVLGDPRLEPGRTVDVQDERVETPFFRGGWNIKSHLLYWRSRRVVKDVAATIKPML